MILLTDGSADPKSGIGFGAYLLLDELPKDLTCIKDLIKIKQFENTSSTKLELQTLLWALSETTDEQITSYTDSQNIVRLLSRKEKLVKNNYYSKSGKQLKNHELYKDFFKAIDKIDIQFHFITGHKPSKDKTHMDKIFSLVDRSTRSSLRNWMK